MPLKIFAVQRVISVLFMKVVFAVHVLGSVFNTNAHIEAAYSVQERLHPNLTA
jgi:hypothetical protein